MLSYTNIFFLRFALKDNFASQNDAETLLKQVYCLITLNLAYINILIYLFYKVNTEWSNGDNLMNEQRLFEYICELQLYFYQIFYYKWNKLR